MNNTGTENGDRLFDVMTCADMIGRLDGMLTICKQETLGRPNQQTYNKQKLYFAGPWFDEKASAIYDACEDIAIHCDDKSSYKIFWPRRQLHSSPIDVFTNNVKNVSQCDALIALISRKDVGTAFEIGIAYSLNKPIYLLGYDKTCFTSKTNVMLAYCGRCLTMSDFHKMLCDIPYKNVKINDGWEGKE